mmetsp:Transcript_10980/g.17627  ORF Transcript_10980/g.17627 Transcript_10980/m.17627 type:complete len:197 (-) Transcript_10980:21-611(-)
MNPKAAIREDNGGVSASADSRDRAAAAVVSVARLDWFTPDMTPFAGRPFDVVLACDVLYTPAAVDVIAPLVVRLFRGADMVGTGVTVGGGGDRDGDQAAAVAGVTCGKDGLFILADPPGRFPLNHFRFLSLMEDPLLVGQALSTNQIAVEAPSTNQLAAGTLSTNHRDARESAGGINKYNKTKTFHEAVRSASILL